MRPSLLSHWDYPFSARLFPGSVRTACPHCIKEHPAACLFWPGPISRFGPLTLTRFIDDSHLLRMRNLPGPHAALRLAASSALSPVVMSFEGTLFPELRTRPLPVAHVRVGNCWPYSRSRHGEPRVTRQKRTLPSTTLPIYVRRTATRVAHTEVS